MSAQYMAAFIWLGAAVFFGIVELVTVQLTTVWFALGALVSMVLAFAGVKSIPVQIAVFVAVSAAALFATRPLVKKVIHKNKQATNADRNIGQTVTVLTAVDNGNGGGTVNLGGVTWSAKSENGEVIPEGAKAVVRRIEGVKLVISAE